MTLTIKETTRADIPGLKAVLDTIDLFPAEMLEDMLEPTLDGKSDALWHTAHLGGRVIGLAYTRAEIFTDRTWNLLALGVHADAQSSGAGKTLVRAVEDTLRTRAQLLLIIETSSGPDLEPARAFYRANGYNEHARIKDFWAEGDDKIIYHKAL